eukprot:8492847-Pyramimonas_sp.AAC.1
MAVPMVVPMVALMRSNRYGCPGAVLGWARIANVAKRFGCFSRAKRMRISNVAARFARETHDT